jgi:hypothetical protein
MTISVEQMVQREVRYCVSYLVATLAGGYGSIENRDRLHSRGQWAEAALSELTEQAFELACPIDDWEEAAIEAGWYQNTCAESEWFGYWHNNNDDDASDPVTTAQEACEADNLDPYYTEVYEHWIVSDWLADQLIARGEKVDKDFGGMTVWARTTTGQGIASDSVIEAIHAALVGESV